MIHREIIIVGGGIVGCAVARELAASGGRVTLLERGEIGEEASAAAAGIVGVDSETGSEPLLRLAVESRRLYETLVSELREETGIEVEFSRLGSLAVAMDEADLAALGERLRWLSERGRPVQRLQAAEVWRREPEVSRGALGGALFPEDNSVDNGALTRALAAAAEKRGAELLRGEEAVRVTAEGGRVTGVQTRNRQWRAEVVINAAGAWAGNLEGAPSLPISPVRGQMVALQAGPLCPRHTVYGERAYAVPRRGGRVLLGSTREHAGFEKSVTAGGVGQILAAALQLLPGLGGAALAATWSGLRPATPDDLPIVGPHPALAGYLVAGGLYRNGILLAPVIAKLVAACVAGREHPALAALAPGRFG